MSETTTAKAPRTPVLEAWEWQMHGACRGQSAELFFHPWGERDPSRSRRDAAAVAICQTCPVIAQCRDYALRVGEPYGVWGGLTEGDREAIAHGRRTA